MIQGIGHIAVTVRDMDESIRFYEKALGFRRAFGFRHPETGAPWIEYLHIASGEFVELFYGGVEARPWNDGLIGFNHMCFQVDDIHASVEAVRLNWQAWVTDPNGIRIELMQIVPGSPQSRFR